MDDYFTALADASRRQLLLVLLDEQCITVDWFVGLSRGGVNRREPHVRTELYHNHLPKLDTLGFIRWREPTGRIERGPRFEEIVPLLHCISENYGY